MRRLVMEASIAEIGANWNKKDFFLTKKSFFLHITIFSRFFYGFEQLLDSFSAKFVLEFVLALLAQS